MKVVLFRVLFDPDRSRIDTTDDVMGWGIEFPESGCYIEWNRSAFPESDQLEHPHVSMYGSRSDVEQGTGGNIEVLLERTVARIDGGTDP